MSNNKYYFYKGLFKGNYIKGANTLEGMMKNAAQLEEITGSPEAMSVIFEPMTYGGRHILPDVFYTGEKLIGKGLQTYLRGVNPDFDGGDILGSIQTIEGIAGDASARALFVGNSTGIAALLGSATGAAAVFANAGFVTQLATDAAFLTVLRTDSSARANIYGSRTMMDAIRANEEAVNVILGDSVLSNEILAHQPAIEAMANSEYYMKGIVNTPIFKTAADNTAMRNAMTTSPAALAAIAGSANAVNTLAEQTQILARLLPFMRSSAAMEAFMTDETSRNILVGSSSFLALMFSNYSSNNARETAVKSREFLTALSNNATWTAYFETGSQLNMSAGSTNINISSVNWTEFKTMLAASPLAETAQYASNTSWNIRRTGRIWLISIYQSSVSLGTGSYDTRYTLRGNETVSVSRENTYNAHYRTDRFMTGIENMNPSGLNANITYTFISLA